MRSCWRVVAGSEFVLTLKRPLWWVLVGLLTVLSFGISTGSMKVNSGDSSVGGKSAWVTSEVSITYLLSISLLLYLFFALMTAGTAVLRDDEQNTLSLLRPTRLTPAEYVLGKSVGVFGAFALAGVVQVALMVLCNHLLHSTADTWIGPLQPAAYVLPLLTLLLPNIALFVSVGVLTALASRRAVAVYIVPVFVLLVCMFFLWDFEPTWLPTWLDGGLMIADPFALRWILETVLAADRGVDFYNHARLPWDGVMVGNRVLVVATTAAATWLAVRRCRSVWRTPTASRRKPRQAVRAGEGRNAAAVPAPLATLGQRQRAPSVWRSIVTVATFELRILARRPGLYLFIPLLLVFVVSKIWGVEGPFGTGLIVTAGSLGVEAVILLTTLICLALLFYTVESLHRERAQKLDGIYFSTPIASSALVVGKVLANFAVALFVLTVLTAGALLGLAAHPESTAAVTPLLLVWWVLLLPTLLFWIAGVSAVYAATGHRLVTYGVAFGGLVFTGYGLVTNELSWLTNWPLWGTLRWSDISVFELNRTALVLNRVGALVLAALLLQAAIRVFQRRTRDPLRSRLGVAGRLRAARGLAPLGIGALGILIALQRVVAAGPDGDRAKNFREDYRKAHHDTWLRAATPGLADVQLDLDLEPAERAFRVDGAYTVVNHLTKPIPRFAVTTAAHFRDVHWTLGGERIEPESKAGLVVIEPSKPLGPGAKLTLGFRYRGKFPAGSSRHGMKADQFILPSGVVLTSFGLSSVGATAFPVVGYMNGVGVDRDNKTEPRRFFPGFHERRLDPYLGSPTTFTSRIRITGPADFTFNSVGEQTSDQTEGDRRTVVWEAKEPVRFFNVVGARYQVRRGKGVAVFYDQRHPHNVDVMLRTLEAARKHYGAWFGEYPYAELKLSEFPALATYAQGFPSNITFAEGIGFLADGKLNAAMGITAHEAAHQWWANLLTPGEGPGAAVLAESLSHFSTLLLLEQLKGPDETRAFAKMLERRYLKNRRTDGERPLSRVDGSREGDTTLFYEKGGMVFWMLMHQAGREPLLKGLKSFIAQYRNGPDYPAVPDLLRALRAHAADGPDFDRLSHQLFEQVVLPEYRLTDTTKRRVDAGWQLSGTLRNAGTGDFDVRVAAVASAHPAAGAERCEQSLRVLAGATVSIALTCPFEPVEVVVDPDAQVLQVGRSAARSTL